MDVQSIETELINGDDVDTSGIDMQVKYPFESALFGGTSLTAGGNMTYLLDFDVETGTGTNYNAAGKFNDRSTVLPIEVKTLPKVRANAYVSAMHGNHNARMFLRYKGEADVPSTFSVASAFPNLSTIDSMVTVDLHYGFALLDQAAEITFSVINAMDEDPPLAPTENGYDAYTHNPQGRIFKLGLTYSL